MDVGRCEMLRWLLLGGAKFRGGRWRVGNVAVDVGRCEMLRWMLAGVKCCGGCWQCEMLRWNLAGVKCCS